MNWTEVMGFLFEGKDFEVINYVGKQPRDDFTNRAVITWIVEKYKDALMDLDFKQLREIAMEFDHTAPSRWKFYENLYRVSDEQKKRIEEGGKEVEQKPVLKSQRYISKQPEKPFVVLKKKKRTCLRCLGEMVSRHAGHRICAQCKKHAHFHRVDDPVYSVGE